jgi:excisionase family DNA binding protein
MNGGERGNNERTLVAAVRVSNLHHTRLSDALAGNEESAIVKVDFQPGSVLAAYEYRWLRIEQAADYISVTITAMKAVVRKGDIPHIKVGRRYLIDRRAIDAYLEGLQGGARRQ